MLSFLHFHIFSDVVVRQSVVCL